MTSYFQDGGHVVILRKSLPKDSVFQIASG